MAALALPLLAGGPAAARGQTRTFNLLNLCGETIWVGSQGIPQPATTGWELPYPATACTESSQCTSQAPPGAGWTCNTAAGQCQLAVTVPLSLSRFWPMTDCHFDSTGACPSTSGNCCATGGCTAGSGWGLNCTGGAETPMTIVEFTLDGSAGYDYYDVSVVNGFNVPVEVTAGTGVGPCPKNFTCGYWCGNPGGTSPLTGLQACSWAIDASCNGNPALRTVDPTTAPCSSSAPCTGASQCTTVSGTTLNVCRCSEDSDCAAGQYCGVGNNQIIGYRVCGSFAGCTTPGNLCGLYFDYQPVAHGPLFGTAVGGEPCCTDNPLYCASQRCEQKPGASEPLGCAAAQRGVCANSPADSFACNRRHGGTILPCQQTTDCPSLVGTTCEPCEPNCPKGTTCLNGLYNLVCVNGQCSAPPCLKDEECLTAFEGTYMLCDLTAGSPTYQRCVSTNASLFQSQGVNGVSCYAQGPTPGITPLCGGCPSQSGNPLAGSWPPLPANWQCASNNPDWVTVMQPFAAMFKTACPTAYSFEFDDPTSSFQCTSTGTTNSMGYTITFCPAATPAAKPKTS